jgi:superfamily II DNA or RNA helicase
MSRELFDYQKKQLDDGDAARAQGHRHILNHGATGSGKTDLMCAKVRREIDEGHNVLILADTIEIIDQIVARLALYRVAAGIIMGGRPFTPWCRVQVATRQSLTDRFFERNGEKLPNFTRIHIDEAHGAGALSYRKIFQRYPEALRDGYTATPGRKGGYGLGPVFDIIVSGPSVKRLQELKRLVPTVTYAPLLGDLNGVRTRKGDYVEADLEKRLNKPQIVGDVVSHWLRLAQGRLTLVYAVTIAHAIAIRDAFRAAGIRCEYVCGKTLPEERAAILAMLAAGEITVVVNVGVLTKGFDCPPASCIQVARPTKSVVLWLQIIGRGLRSHPGKENCVVIDHGGMANTLGLAEDEYLWTLKEDEAVVNVTASSDRDHHGDRFVECSQCSAQRRAEAACDVCGYYPPPAKPEDVIILNGDLGLVDRSTRMPEARDWTPAQRQEFYQMLLAIRREQGKPVGAAYYAYREKFPDAPKPPYAWTQLPSVEPSLEAHQWLRHCAIQYAKRMEKQKASAPVSAPPMQERMVTAAKVGRACTCGCQLWNLDPPKGPHASGLRCAACGKHGGWLPKEKPAPTGVSRVEAYQRGLSDTPF